MRTDWVLGEIEHQDRNRLDGMARGLDDLQTQSRKVERVAILHWNEGILGCGAGTQMDDCPTAIAKFQVAGDEVRVEVRKEDVADLEAKFGRIVQILLNVALWIDDDRGRTGLVSD